MASTPLMRYRFPYVGADLRKLALQPGTSEHCKTTDTGVSRDMPVCLYYLLYIVCIVSYNLM